MELKRVKHKQICKVYKTRCGISYFKGINFVNDHDRIKSFHVFFPDTVGMLQQAVTYVFQSCWKIHCHDMRRKAYCLACADG